MSETRKLAAILVADIVGYSRLAEADEEGTLARLREAPQRARRTGDGDHHGHIIKRTGDGRIIEFRSVVDAVRCAIEVQSGMVERNADVPEEKRIVYRIGVNLGDVADEGERHLGEGVNIAARLGGHLRTRRRSVSRRRLRQVRAKIDAEFIDLGEKDLKNIARPVRVYSLSPVAVAANRPIDRRPPAAFLARRAEPLGVCARLLAAGASLARGGRGHIRGGLRSPTCWRARRVCRWSCCRSKI